MADAKPAKALPRPVSDKSLYLWLSAVLGVWLGSQRFCACLGWYTSKIDHRVFMCLEAGVGALLSVCIIGAAPAGLTRSARFGLAVRSVCITLLARIGVDAYNQGLFITVPIAARHVWDLLTDEGLQILGVRFVLSWALVGLGACVMARTRRRRVVCPSAPCLSCGFDQAGLPPHDVCPECGAYWQAPPMPRSQRHARLTRIMCQLVVILGALNTILSGLPEWTVVNRYAELMVRATSRYYMGSGGPFPRSLLFRRTAQGMIYILTTEQGRSVYLDVEEAYTQEFGYVWEVPTIHSQLWTGDPHAGGTQSTLLIDEPGLIPLSDIIRALEEHPRP